MIRRLNYRTRLLILALGLSAAPYFVNLGISSLWDTNEAFYAETPREMIESGNFSDPTFNYLPRLNKPPLSYWIVAGSYRLFGISEGAERVPIALGAVILMATAFALGRAAASNEAGLISAIALAANPRFLFFARRIIIDVYMAMFLSLALLFFAFALRAIDRGDRSRRRLYLVMMYVAIGLAVITKGPVGVVLPALTFLLFVLISKRFNLFRETMLLAGLVLVAVIVLPWYVSVYLNHGWRYIATFLLGDNLSRYTSGNWGPSRSVFFYVPVLLGDLFPWSLLLIPALATTLLAGLHRVWHRALRWSGRGASASAGGERKEVAGRLEVLRLAGNTNLLLFLWIVSIVAFFSLSKGKEDLYILPIYPAAMAIVGVLLGRFLDGGATTSNFTRLVSRILVVTGGAVLATGCALLYLRRIVPASLHLAGVVPIGVAAICGGGLIVLAVVMKRRFVAVLAVMLTMAAINWVIVLRMVPDYERFQPVPPIAEIIRNRAGAKARVCYFKYPAPSLVYYLSRRIYEYSDDEREAVQGLLSSGKEVYCLTPESELEKLRAGTGPLFILARRTLFKLKLKSIHSGDDPPQLILVTNRSE
jgi:4-amino-4-deoxy-L-arabinose transferase-like glycosyltransferase